MACAFGAVRNAANAFRLMGELDANGAETYELGDIVVGSGNNCAFEMPFSSENSSLWTNAAEKIFYTGKGGDYSTAVEVCAAEGGYLPMIRTQKELDGLIGKAILFL